MVSLLRPRSEIMLLSFAAAMVLALAQITARPVTAFVPSTASNRASGQARVVITPTATTSPLLSLAAAASTDNNDANEKESESQLLMGTTTTRREWFQKTSVSVSVAVASAMSGLGYSSTAAWAIDPSIGSSPEHPIVILGAGGKVGKLSLKLLADKGLYCRAVTRSGRKLLDADSTFVTYAAGDVTKYEAVAAAVQGASGVIFAASASGKNKGGDPAHVDYLGLVNTAKACLQYKVPKLAIVSAAAVTRPDSMGYKATNLFVKYIYGDNIMGYKIAGEAAVRDLYAGKSGVAYTVIRPGGLNDKPSVGASNVHISQGDVYASEIPREDVALVTVAALLAGKVTDNTTFELNQREGLAKVMESLPTPPPQLVHTGKPSFDALLDGLLSDDELASKYPSFMNSNFRGGDNILPLEKLA